MECSITPREQNVWAVASNVFFSLIEMPDFSEVCAHIRMLTRIHMEAAHTCTLESNMSRKTYVAYNLLQRRVSSQRHSAEMVLETATGSIPRPPNYRWARQF
eukprot:5519697-Pyramimonas_sp.AAC.1